MLTKRDQFTLIIDDNAISQQRDTMRRRNHLPSAKSKARGKSIAVPAEITIGELISLNLMVANTKQENYILFRM